VNYCDTIRQSASSSRRRVFIIETQGGRSGYIATMGGLAVGALAVYTPEEGISLRMLSRDIEYLRRNFENDKGQGRAGKLILRNEMASETYTTKMIQEMIKDEAKGRFEARYAVPGHVQQGGRPSPMDRMRAQRLAVKCIEHLERFAGMGRDAVIKDTGSAAIIGIKGSQIIFTGMDQADKITDFKNRRPAEEYWVNMKDTIDMLSGRPKPNDCCSECGRSKNG
jgi:6-phosphofructokinase 1